jgi:uncharacterized membrane protein YccC
MPYPHGDHPRPLAALWRALIHFDRQRIDPWMGLRNALGVALPIAIGVSLNYPAAGLVGSTGALNVAAADGADSYRDRATRMLMSSVICSLAVCIGALVARNDAAAVLVAALWAFAAGLAVCLGTVTADIAMISLVVVIIYSAQSMSAPHAAWSGLIALAGGLLQTGLSIAPWPLRGLRPERRRIGDFFLELARVALLPPDPYGAPPASAQSTQATQSLASLASDHSLAAERHFLLVSEAERIRLSLFALGRARTRLRREADGAPAAAPLDQFLELASRLLAAIGRSLHDEPLPDSADALLAEAAATVESLRGTGEHPLPPLPRPHLADALPQMDALTGQLRAALELARNTTPTGQRAYAARQAEVAWPLRLGGWLATLRANLSLDSSACRHALRLALCIAVGSAIARHYGLHRPYWLAMTIALVLKPDFGSTFGRGILRLAGTYAGLLLATLLYHASPAGAATVAWIVVLAFLTRSVGRANYGLLVVGISALIVFLFALIGYAPKDIVAARALNTTIGGALALAIYWLWPTRERTQLPPAFATMLDAYRLYFQAVTSAHLDPARVAPAALERLRLNARLARSNVETSLDRLGAEPYADAAQLRLINAMLASSHRFIHAAIALEAGLATSTVSSTAGPAFQAFSHDLEKTLYFVAASFRGSPVEPASFPDLREDHIRLVHSGIGPGGRNALLAIETDRMTNSLNTLTGQVVIWAATPREQGA